jgi:hypothetical protein
MSLLRSAIQNNAFKNIELVGWYTLSAAFSCRVVVSSNPIRYWYLEDIPDFDMELISFVSASAHAAGEVVTWIPSWDGSSEDAVWKDVSADQVSACFCGLACFHLRAHFSTDGLLGWIRLCYTAAQLRL